MQLNIRTVTIASLGLLFLSACSGSNSATNSGNSPASSAPTQTQATPASPVANSATSAKTGATHSHGGQGGQVIESGPYHLELVTKKETTGTHIDFFLQTGDNHEPIPNAKVTAQIQLPDGSQQSLDMKYDAQDKHYTGILPGTVPGEYKIAVLTDINGEKVNGRYRFTR